jgi:cyanophycin synthetase
MKILETKVMKGPNYWSNYRHNLVVLKLDIGDLEAYPTNLLPGFPERLKSLLPSLQSHRCSKDFEGGFFERLHEGTWIGHVIEHIALELQCLAGMECGFGRTRTAHRDGVYYVVITYEIESAGLYAAKAAINIAESLIKGESYDVNEDIRHLREIKAREGFGPSTQSIIEEASKRKIPYRRMDDASLIMLGQGVNQKRIRASMTCATSSFGVETACDKEETKKMLEKAFIPVPAGDTVRTVEGAVEAALETGFPVVIKPLDGNHGRGITTNVRSVEEVQEAFAVAKKISNTVIIEKYIAGEDYRFLVINYKLVAVAKRTPALVMGDGILTIRELIDQVNADPDRGEGHEKIMTSIKVDEVTETVLKKRGLTLTTVLPLGEILFLKDTANLSTGGTSTDVTDNVHPQSVFMAERIARLLNLDICGIDVVAADITAPIDGINGAVIEVNACPGLRMHLSPQKGLGRNVAEPILDMLYPSGKSSRIPLVAVTGTNGKTTTTRLTAHIAKTAGHHVGYTTTDGIYIQDYMIHAGDCTGSQSAATILGDPTVDFAVLECARGGIIRSGLGFDHCDISIITNISDDHLGLKDIHSLSDMARVKAVVAQSTFYDGYAILNADDDLVYDMIDELDCNIALFSMNPTSNRIKRHNRNGGLSAIVEKGYFTICKGEWKIRISKVESVPLTLNGRAECMIKNVLPAILAAIISNFKIEVIRTALQTFIPSPEFTPGRMNIFKFRNFELMLDYVHNTGGFIELKTFMERSRCSHKTGIITGVGDRRNEDMIRQGKLAAEIFDNIIIRHDEDMRGRAREEVTRLIVEGIRSVKPDMEITVISDVFEAVDYAIENAKKHAFVMVSVENVHEMIAYVKKKVTEEKDNYKALDSILYRNG